MFLKAEKYGKNINSYDILKFLAIVIMIVDHTGFFFFSDQPLWRAVGRICVPMWFFMVGYSKARWNDKMVIGGMLLLIAADAYAYSPIFSLNILATITLVRLVHQLFLNRYLETDDVQKFISVMLVMIMLYPATTMLWEYGTLAFLFSIAGMLIRQGRRDGITTFWFVASVASFSAIQAWVFTLPLLEIVLMTTGVMVTAFFLYRFEIKTYVLPGWNAIRVGFLCIARNSLAIYVIHWLIFLSISYHLHPESHMKFQWMRPAEKKEVTNPSV